MLQELVDQGKLWWDAERNAVDHEGWDGWFKELLAYNDLTGHCNVPVMYTTPSGRKLGQWLNNQKRLKRTGELKPMRQTQLQALVDQGYLMW